ncbi:Aquaporin Z [Arthrobacter sp. 9AX]|uniref:aquaporin n=1 Tax=Arthrobacter sp. 9AX TaxID=2653131 RepID=UPI0012EFAE55|nr:aquaporin [Arthrobacter sp. 9AX]VXB50709.1 Aquaporin Z [Arthrobacter sp. 9AX]
MSTPVPARHDALEPSLAEAVESRLLPRLVAEAFGSFFLAFAGLGVPLFSIPQSSPLPAALAAGLAVTAAMLAFGRVSGGHFNPAITAAHLVAGRIRAGSAAAYAGAQLAGALVAALALYGVLRTLPGIADSRAAFDTVTAGFGEHSIIQAPLAAVLLLEMIGAAIITAVFLGTARRDSNGRSAAPVAVGLTFAVLLQLGLSVGNLPFNPARAIGSAVFSSGWALEQLWVFVVAPLAGAVIAGLAFRSFSGGPAASGETLVAGADDDGEAPIDEPTGDTVEEPAAKATKNEASEAQEFFDGRRG